MLDDSTFSDEFCRFLQRSVSSVDAAELLLGIAADPQRWWQADELAASLRPGTRVSDADTRRYLEQFQTAFRTLVGA